MYLYTNNIAHVFSCPDIHTNYRTITLNNGRREKRTEKYKHASFRKQVASIINGKNKNLYLVCTLIVIYRSWVEIIIRILVSRRSTI